MTTPELAGKWPESGWNEVKPQQIVLLPITSSSLRVRGRNWYHWKRIVETKILIYYFVSWGGRSWPENCRKGGGWNVVLGGLGFWIKMIKMGEWDHFIVRVYLVGFLISHRVAQTVSRIVSRPDSFARVELNSRFSKSFPNIILFNYNSTVWTYLIKYEFHTWLAVNYVRLLWS